MEELLEDLIPCCDNYTSKTFDELLDDLTSTSEPQRVNVCSSTVENRERCCVSTHSLHSSQLAEVSVQRRTIEKTSERLSTRCEHQQLKQECVQFESPSKCPNQRKCLTFGFVTLGYTAGQRLVEQTENLAFWSSGTCCCPPSWVSFG